METPPSASFALALAPVSSPVTELANQLKEHSLIPATFTQPYIHLFHNIPGPDFNSLTQVTSNLHAGLTAWREAEVARNGPNHTVPKTLQIDIVGMGATDEGVLFVDLEELEGLASLYKHLEEHTIGNGAGRDAAVPYFAHPPPEDYPRFDLIRTTRSKAAELVDELHRNKTVYELQGGGSLVAGKDLVEVEEIVVLQGTPTKWEEVARVPLV